MKAFIFDPLWDTIITPQLLWKLDQAGLDILVKKHVHNLHECKELFLGDEERIVCLNPDAIDWSLTAEDYKDIPHLKAILCSVTSLSWLDSSYANDHNIPICNIRNYSTQAVAEWAILTALALARRLPLLIKDKFPLDFNEDFIKYQGKQIRGMTAGIIGLGNIGTAIAERCQGLGMEVTYWSRSPKKSPYHRVELDTLMSKSDIIFPAVALHKDTIGLISDDHVRSIKPSALFISIDELYNDRLFNHGLILEMVKKMQLFGFGFEASPATFNQYEGNVWAVPPYAWDTKTSIHNAINIWVEAMVRIVRRDFSFQVAPGQTT